MKAMPAACQGLCHPCPPSSAAWLDTLAEACHEFSRPPGHTEGDVHTCSSMSTCVCKPTCTRHCMKQPLKLQFLEVAMCNPNQEDLQKQMVQRSIIQRLKLAARAAWQWLCLHDCLQTITQHQALDLHDWDQQKQACLRSVNSDRTLAWQC